MSSLLGQKTPAHVASDTIPTPLSPQATDQPRLYYLDHLRAALTILVVLFHLAVIYEASSAIIYYVEPPSPHDHVARLLLVPFERVNQAFFMGCFFLIAGYFTPGSFDRKGARAFLRDRLLRLGIPLIAYVVILSPIASLGLYFAPATSLHLPPPFTWRQLPSLLGVGPLWFAEMLLLFSLGYVIWRRLVGIQTSSAERGGKPPGYLAVGLFVLALALASYLMRIVVPIGLFVPIFGFPTLAYLPQYLSFFVLGIIAFRRNWFATIPGSMGAVGLVAAVVSTIFHLSLLLPGGKSFVGHGTAQSAAYAVWDSTFSVGICLALLTFFRRFLNRESRVGRFLSRQAFTVYIIHLPIIVLLALALRGIRLEHILKFGLAALIGVPLCFLLAFLVRKIPRASTVL